MNIDIVIVTYNRLEKLKKALSCYDAQTTSFRNLILVNNCSTDGTSEFISEWEKIPAQYNKIVINSAENVGGSGGFYLGEKKAMELQADWVYLSDDDAYAEPELVSKFISFLERHSDENFSAVCASVRLPDGTICDDHRQCWRLVDNKIYQRYSPDIKVYDDEFFRIDFLSYVGVFINVAAMRQFGLVNPDYFIYFDDSEHSFRLKRYGDIICVSDMRVIHDTVLPVTDNYLVSWRDYYMLRNNANMLRKHLPLRAKIWHFKHFLIYGGKGKSTNPDYLKLYVEATWDGILGRLGRSTKFPLGWKVRN